MTRQQRQQKDFLIFFATVQESNLQVQSSSKLTESQIGQQAIGWFLGPWWWSACSHSTTLLKHSVFSVILCLKRTKINKKEAGVGPLFFKKKTMDGSSKSASFVYLNENFISFFKYGPNPASFVYFRRLHNAMTNIVQNLTILKCRWCS